MNISRISRLALALAFGVTLSACSSTPPDQRPSEQVAPGTASRPILSAAEAKNFTRAHYFSAMDPNAAPWTPSSINLPKQPDFVVGPAGAEGVTHTSIQAAVDAAIAAETLDNWTVSVDGADILFIRDTVGVCVAPTSTDTDSTGVTFSAFARQNEGVAAVWASFIS